ncbi:hypothetical protein ART_1191 [Arthrobacter sp. PAMC 25486]|nr:hypothetical protein ART_1191 [Arthrobacter sp. PAMC 25486]
MHLESGAFLATSSGAPLIVLGKSGSGRTAFVNRILGAQALPEKAVHRLSGAHALRGIPFAALATVVAQLTGPAFRTDSPAHLMATLARSAAAQRSTIFIDHSDAIDDQSAAAFSQLASSGALSLVCIARSIATLPQPVRQLAVSSAAHRVELEAIGLDDAVVLLEEFLGGRVNASAATVLLGHAGGNPLHLRELAFDAQAHDALTVRRGYWTLGQGWHPRGERITELISTRLAEQSGELREAVEILALTGELPLGFATALVAPEVLDRAHDAGLLDIQGSSGEIPTAALGSALTPETVLATLGRSALRAHSNLIRAALPREKMHPQTRLSLALHSQNLDVLTIPAELLQDAGAACRARQFEAVLVLTRLVHDGGFAQWADVASRIELALLRAEALQETGRADEALLVLSLFPEQEVDRVRSLAAWIEFSGRGNLPAALARLAVREDDSIEIRAFARLLALVGNQPCDFEALTADATNPAVSANLRMSISSQLLVEASYRGLPTTALEQIVRLLDCELWQLSSPSSRGEILQAILLAAHSDSTSEPRLSAIYAQLDWDNLAVDHATFVVSQAWSALESGNASLAADLAGQALALVDVVDPHQLTGFIAACQGAASAMLDDRKGAASAYELFHSSPVTGGHSLRAESERAMLGVEFHLHGRDAACRYFERLVDTARARGRDLLVMRLFHDAWRLGLHEDATAVSETAAGVQGALAASLRRYADVLGEHHADVEDVVAEHVGAGRILFAAELANRAANLARDGGRRARASTLQGMSADLARPLANVNTPSLGRTRIQLSLLTEREREVCIRAARGDSNVSIADELYLSPRTVEGHLQRAYTKLGVVDRRQLLPVV